MIPRILILMLALHSVSSLAAKKFEDWESVENWRNRPSDKFADAEANFKKAKEMILRDHVDESLTEEELYRAATQGMLAALNRRAESKGNKLLSPTELQEMENDVKGEITGIGIEIKFISETGITLITRVIPGSAAQKAGVHDGDQILSIDGKLYKGMQFRDVVYSIRGKTGEKVRLKVLRNDEVLNKTVVRERITWSPVEYSWLEKGVALLSVRYFSDKTPQLIREALSTIKKKPEFKGLIIDLSENSGGLFDKAIEAIEVFVPKGAIVAQVVARDKKTEILRSRTEPLLSGTPVAIVIGPSTASGAELFAASLSENLGARLVGERTVGKWDAQSLEKLGNQYAIKFTTKLFKSPKGNSYSEKGLSPDIEVAGALTQKAAASLIR